MYDWNFFSFFGPDLRQQFLFNLCKLTSHTVVHSLYSHSLLDEMYFYYYLDFLFIIYSTCTEYFSHFVVIFIL